MANPSPNNSVGILLAAADGFPLQVGNENALPVEVVGTVAVVPPATYSAAITGLVVAAAATDVFTLIGSASKVVRVTRIGISVTGGAAVAVDVQIIKRSAANTGGTSTTPAGVPHDSTNAAATAVARAYTVNPSGLGAAVGTVRSRKYLADVVTGAGMSQLVLFDVAAGDQPFVLRGVAETLALNLNGGTVTTPLADIFVEWTEAAT